MLVIYAFQMLPRNRERTHVNAHMNALEDRQWMCLANIRSLSTDVRRLVFMEVRPELQCGLPGGGVHLAQPASRSSVLKESVFCKDQWGPGSLTLLPVVIAASLSSQHPAACLCWPVTPWAGGVPVTWRRRSWTGLWGQADLLVIFQHPPLKSSARLSQGEGKCVPLS